MGRVRYLIGIDEAGRGPLAGPVAVAAVMVSEPRWKFLRQQFPPLSFRLRDSKRLSAIQREKVFSLMKEERQNGRLRFAVSLVGHSLIDRLGIVMAVKIGVRRCLRRLACDFKTSRILLDGALKAPPIYKNQQTIIRGDEREPLIALASIVAKVRRDRRMITLAKIYPDYDFEKHKGYGTETHYLALQKLGPSPIHRRAFL